jgi:hypothetical protein
MTPNTELARQHCANARADLDQVRTAIRQIESSVDNPNWPDPLGSAAYAIASLREYLAKIEQDLGLPAREKREQRKAPNT